ncbi:MAG: peptide ABC transporter substrate-binding protein, partial [Planctomycetota bacterium]
MMDERALEQAMVRKKGWTGAALVVAVLALFGGWAAVLLARSRTPPPPLPPYELPKLTADQPLPEAPSVPLADRQVLTFTNHAEPKTLDPAVMTGVPEMTIALALFEGLTGLHPETLQPVPGVAERWDLSDDGRVYTFHLRRCRWSNGDPLTADDFVYAWRRVLEPETAARYAYMLYCIEGAQAFNAGETNDPETVGAHALDAYTLEVRLEHPVAYFLELTAFGTYAPVHPATVEAHPERWTRPEHLVANGPFVLDAWRQQQEVVLAKNPLYWNADRVLLERVRVLPVDDAETALKQYRNDEVHWIRSIPAPKVAAAATLPGFRYAPEYGTYFYRFNVTRPPLDDPRVRQALALAVDKKSICRYLLRG